MQLCYGQKKIKLLWLEHVQVSREKVIFQTTYTFLKYFLKSAKWSYAKLSRENSVSMLKKLLSHVKHF